MEENKIHAFLEDVKRAKYTYVYPHDGSSYRKDVIDSQAFGIFESMFRSFLFDNKEIVEGITKLTSYGMTAKDVLPKVGDMASVMGKSLDQAVEAIADALHKVWASLNWVISVKAKSLIC